METASRTLDERDAPGDVGRRRRAARLLFVAAVILLAPLCPSARPTQKEGQLPPKQFPPKQPAQRPPLKVSATAEPSSLELCPNKPARVRLSVSGLDRLAGFASYDWKASAGDIEGEGATVTWDLSRAKPGVHAAQVFVSFRAPTGAPLGNGQAMARVNLRECQPGQPPPTPGGGQNTSPVVNTSPVPPATTPSPPPRTPTPSPTASPALSPTPSSTAALTPTPPAATSPPVPDAGPNEAGTTEPSGGRAASYFWPALITLFLLLAALAGFALVRFLTKSVKESDRAALPEVKPQGRPNRQPPTMRRPRGSSGRQKGARADGGIRFGGVTKNEEVLCSVFAPHAVAPGDGFLVQAFAHLAKQAALLPGLAKEAEQRAERRGAKALGQVERGQELRFHLEAPGLEVDEPSQSIVWRGRVESAQFGVTVPESFAPRAVNCKLTIVHPNMLGHIRFSINVAAAPAPPADGGDALELFDKLVRYRQAFVSYASEDRAEVLKRVQILRALKVRFFQDVLSLEPGERWQKELYRNIDLSDVFLLFWSAAAHRSEWVEKEVRYALARKGGGDEAPPEIVPVILQGPPEVPPPDYLPEQHFNDPLASLIKAEEAARRAADDA